MITSRIPTIKKVNPSYINYLYKIVNEEDTATTEMPPIPPYKKEKLKMTETFKSSFGSLIGKLSL